MLYIILYIFNQNLQYLLFQYFIILKNYKIIADKLNLVMINYFIHYIIYFIQFILLLIKYYLHQINMMLFTTIFNNNINLFIFNDIPHFCFQNIYYLYIVKYYNII